MLPRRHRRPVLRDGAATLLVLVLLLVPGGLAAQRAHFDSVASPATNVPDGFTVVAVGDVIIGRALTTRDDPGFRTVTQLLQSGDVTFGNKEGSLIDLRSFEGHPQAEFGGAYHIAAPAVADDLRAMGFNLMGVANNHLLDWGVEGMRETLVHLDRAGIAHAGAGEDLGRAAAAGYLETAGGRVALVSVASSFTPLSRAGAPTPKVTGRPGVNALRLSRTAVLPPRMVENLREIRDALPGPERDEDGEGDGDQDAVELLGERFRTGEEPAFTYEPDEDDVRRILTSVGEGKRLSDFLVFTQHAHEPGNWSLEPADYLPELARSVVDEGADVFIGHGPHRLRGIEIYRGRPIFYSLGNFIFHDNLTPVPYAMYERNELDPGEANDSDVNAAMGRRFATGANFESVVAVSRFEGGRVAEIRLHPVELRRTARLANRGVPRPAPPDVAERILTRLQELSEPFGTVIEIEDGVGVVRVPADPTENPDE